MPGHTNTHMQNIYLPSICPCSYLAPSGMSPFQYLLFQLSRLLAMSSFQLYHLFRYLVIPDFSALPFTSLFQLSRPYSCVALLAISPFQLSRLSVYLPFQLSRPSNCAARLAISPFRLSVLPFTSFFQLSQPSNCHDLKLSCICIFYVLITFWLEFIPPSGS